MFYTYFLESLTSEDIYIGYTNDLVVRVTKHNQGKVESTKRLLPWKLIYYEACLNRDDARRRENYFKTSQGRRLLRRRLK